MITSSYDTRTEAIITPESFFGEQQHICDIAIATFSREIYAVVSGDYPCEEIGFLHAVNWVRPINLLDIGGRKIAFYLSEIGSALASTDIIEVNHKTGARHFIVFGSAGSLDRDATECKYVIPTAAYRDEGMSYHYMPPSDYVVVKNADFLEKIFIENNLPYVRGRAWTTDALYRETRGLVQQRKSEGCIAVEMELAGMQAVCNYHGLELYDFLVTGDVVDQPDYTPAGLSEANHSIDKFDVALMIAERIAV